MIYCISCLQKKDADNITADWKERIVLYLVEGKLSYILCECPKSFLDRVLSDFTMGVYLSNPSSVSVQDGLVRWTPYNFHRVKREIIFLSIEEPYHTIVSC